MTKETASERSCKKLFVLSEECLSAIPKTIPQTRIPRKLPPTIAPIGLVIMPRIIVLITSKTLAGASPAVASIPSSGNVGLKMEQRRTAQTAAAKVPIK